MNIEGKLMELDALVLQMPTRRLKKFVQSGAESMDEIEDNSVDAVVSSHVLCSVGGANKVLREIHRVLKPVSLNARDNSMESCS